MSGTFQDSCQWLSVTEETLFLHDGLIRVTDLVELPRDVNNSQEGDNEVVTFDLKTPKELSERLLAVCGTQNNAYARLLEYRLNALKGYWNAQKQVLVDEQQERDGTSHEETIALLKKQGLFKEPEQASFSTRISVLLVIPLLQSQSRLDPNLCSVTAELLLSCLRDCAPLSLSKEPGDCLRGLEHLLCAWLGEKKDGEDDTQQLLKDAKQRGNTAAALVALACARGHLKTFIHTVYLLQSLTDIDYLPVADVLTKLMETEGGQAQPSAILGSKHVLCWGFEDMLGGAEKETATGDKDKEKDGDMGRSIACDGVFLYTTNSQGRGLAKLGTGLHGSLRGYGYNRNPELGPGKVSYGNSCLLYRPQSFDQDTNLTSLCQVIDSCTLQCVKTIPKPDVYLHEGAQTTVAFCSDGTYFYWIWCPAVVSDKNAKGLNVYMEMFSFNSEDGTVVPVQQRLVLQRKDEASAKALNETLLSRLRPFRGNSSAATLVALSGADSSNNRKDDAALLAGSTTCGISLKNLVKTPVFCDGTTVVFLTNVPGSGGNSATSRSLFGSGGSLSGLRLLATNMCFNVKDGQFNTRIDLTDAPTCSLGRGSPLLGLGLCFDVANNSVWMSSSDWVDQFYNHGHQAPHHINQRLRIPLESQHGEGNNIDISIVIKQLLKHVGSMCLHQINNDLLHTPLGSYILQQHPADLSHLTRICHILERAIQEKDSQVIICALIILQLIFKISLFKREREGEVQLLDKTSTLAWRLLTEYPKSVPNDDNLTAVISEACQVVTAGLYVLYPKNKGTFLYNLLGGELDSLKKLRNMILIDMADKLRGQALQKEDLKYLCLDRTMVQHILKMTVKESCLLLQESLTDDRDKFEELLASVPCASSCLRYMMALQSHLLREAILHRFTEDEEEKKLEDLQMKELQDKIIVLATDVFDGSCQVLEALLETCNTMITKFKDDLEYRLQGLERISKATILGHLLPVLLTSMTHCNLRWLPLADKLMPKLVHLVVLTSQTALLLKSQVQAVLQEELDQEADSDFIDLIGQSVNITDDLKDNEEQGFLAGLKIPAPWASGKTLESIHPVRDNYKFKETVHIPGARCLYLRFDPRCSSQYDYDKLVIYAGPSTSSKKVTEYGGNTFGFGSRSVLGSGWPKDLVKVEGDTVTFSFEMRSGREHNTPDKAMWGFQVTVRAQEATEEVSSGLPFLADLGLGLSVLACTMLQLLYHGPDKTKEEISCEHLLKSRLLQRCVWQSKLGASLTVSPSSPPIEASEPTSSLPRVRLPSEVLQNLRQFSKRKGVQLRHSIRDLIQPQILEERILSTVIKHLSLGDIVQHIAKEETHKSEEFQLLMDIIDEVYRRVDTLIRQLQSLADLEQRWFNEVLEHREENIQSPEPPFFHDYHLQEGKGKEFTMLCFVKDVLLDSVDPDESMKILREKFDEDVASRDTVKKETSMQRTKHIIKGILSRLDLLLQVNIVPHDTGMLTRTTSHYAEAPQTSGLGGMVRSETDVIQSVPPLSRSMSAPSGVEFDETVLDIIKIQRKRHPHRRGPVSVLQDFIEEENKDRPAHVIFIEQLFSFIGSDPEKAVSSQEFLSAAQTRWRRGNTRKQALIHMKELLTAASKVGGATHLVAAVTAVLQHGPCVEELTCGGMVNLVREAFSETMTSVVQLAARYPIACCNSIGLLCIIPYTRAEEKCLVRSGLVHLLDKLCSLANHRTDSSNTETQSTHQKVSAMAWAGFQVLANRCVMWETEDGLHIEDLEHSGLARQVSVLLTNHLARATECIGNEAAGTEALQDVLSLLNDLSRSRMGRAILSQPACVSKLLSLLLDQRPSPKLVLIILQLCRQALPLMSTTDCECVELPAWGQHLYTSHWNTAESISDPPAKIVSLLLAKLGDFLVPGDYATVCSRRPSVDANRHHMGGSGSDKDKVEDSDIQAGRLSVFIHKREDQLSHEVIQPLLSSDNRPFRLGGGANMERVVRMDREMTKYGKAEVTTEDAVTALKKAAKWAQMGLVVSTGPPIDTSQAETPSGDKKKTTLEVTCRERNSELARTDPVRPFISGHVANNMAAEVIALLHGLLTAPESNTAQSWAEAVQRVLNNSLTCLPLLWSGLESLGSPRSSCRQLMSMAKLANAALCALGGFKEILKPGCTAKVTGAGIHNTTGTILSVSEQTGLATVQLDPDPETLYAPRYSDTIQVPITRLQPVKNEIYQSHQVPVTEAVVMAIKSILLPQDDNLSLLQQTLPVSGDGNSLSNQTCRVVMELQTRACMVLASYLQDIDFTKEFIQHCSSTIDVLKSLAKDCSTGDRLPVLEAHCTRLRMLYRDCAKPPPPPSKVDCRANKEMVWDAIRTFPPVRACVFSSGMTGVTFLGDPNTGSGLPRGTLLYSNQAIPHQAPAFYWELEVCSFGDSQEESGAVISFGFAPAAEKKDGAWTNPVGTCLFLNNGKAVHYNGASLLQWRSARLDVILNAGDVAGIGWERTGDPPTQGQSPKGRVYFTFNGQKLNAFMDDVSGAMYPVVHIQKKNTRIRANFGARPFAFAEGQQHRDAADAANDFTRDMRESFSHLPFHPASDSESESSPPNSPETTATVEAVKSPTGPPCKTASVPKPQKEYEPELCLQYKLFASYDNFVTTGPDQRANPAPQDDESDDDSMEDDQQSEDHYALLVKAWEQKVFPVIRRRFRNEAERKDGLEQIRGALQLGMTDIARQTVEFLYEENGGIPRDLHLPTIDDIKEDLAKFTIERVKKGTAVVIRNTAETSTAGTTVLPKFAVRSMLRTFGLTGTVLDIDSSNELVQVETYLRSEGVLVRFWYPIDMLERPPQGLRRSTITGGQILDTSNVHIHRELLRCESVLARMHCRTALLKLIDHCNSPAMELGSCSASLGSGMAASAALLQQLDIENLQLLSNELLCPPQPHGTIKASSLTMASSMQQCLSAHSCSLTRLLYTDEDKLKRELAVAIARAANQGEDYLIELTNQLCSCLQTAPEMFPFEEFPVTEIKVNTDLHFPGAACLVVSCKTDLKAAKKDTSLYKSPWARVFSYSGHRAKKTGQATKQEVVSYPRDTSSTSNQNEQYTPALVPCDRIHLRLGVSPPPGVLLTIHGMPPQFLLAVAYIETLISEKYGCGTKSCGPKDNASPQLSQKSMNKDLHESMWSVDNIVITPPVFKHIIELVCRYLWTSNVPAMVKEYLFHLLAQALRILHYSEGTYGSQLPTLHPHLNPTQGVLVQLQKELQKLYEEETKGWTSATLSSGQGIGIGVCDKGRFSTYFHALLEANLAIAEVKCKETPRSLQGASALIESPVSSSLQPLGSPTSSAKKKKLKVKRDKERGGAVPKRTSGGSPRVSESEVSASSSSTSEAGTSTSTTSTSSTSSSSSTSQTSSKPEDMLWFHRALTVSQILRCLGFDEKHGEIALTDAVSDAAHVLNTPSAHNRILVITGINNEAEPTVIKRTIRKACKPSGGIYKDEIFLPECKIDKKSAESSPKQVESTENTSKEKSATEAKPRSGSFGGMEIKKTNQGYAVINILAMAKVENVKKALLKCKTLVEDGHTSEEEIVDVPEEMLSVNTVNSSLITEAAGNDALEHYLQYKFFNGDDQKEFSDAASLALIEIFHSCFIMEQKQESSEYKQESGFICLGKDQILQNVPENLLCVFLNNIRPPKKSLTDQVMTVLRRYGMIKSPDKEMSPGADKNGKGKPAKKSPRGSKEKLVLGAVEKTGHRDKKLKVKDIPEKSGKDSGAAESTPRGQKDDSKYLTLDGFLQFVLEMARQDIRSVWKALFTCGFDINYERCSCLDNSQAQQMAGQWCLEMDSALVQYTNAFCRKLTIAPSRLHPHEIHLSESDLSSEKYACLQGIPVESIRLRFALIQSLNNTLETFFLPLVDLRPANTYNRSTAALLSSVRNMIFYDTKVNLMNRVLNASAQRKPDQAAPEIVMDPLETFSGEEKTPSTTWFCQAFRQIATVASSQFCVNLASGGDPTYSFNVRLTGEEVHGTSGSFRQFLWQVAKELQGSILRILIPCSSINNKGKHILTPGHMTFPEERLLQFFGQLLGITIRADIPLGMDLLGSVWKVLVGVNLDPVTDLQEGDQLTYNYIKKIEMAESESEIQALCSDVYPRFVFSSLTGDEVELIPRGGHIMVCWENRQEYVDAIQLLRLQELSCEERVSAVHCGLASLIPLQLLTLMSPYDMEIRTCGLPVVDLDFLKAHTMYQVGLMDTDPHVEFFWNALESLSQDDLCRFIKFACNQERIPQICPCKEGGADSTHVPPYPMKIAPPDGAGTPDSRFIRVETCMFMIKLPQYSSQEIMTQRLLYAIHCREDPLSG